MSDHRHVTFGYPERYFDGDAQAFRFRQKLFETWWENGRKYGFWDWVPAVWGRA